MSGQGSLPAFRRLAALGQLELLRDSAGLIPRLMEMGLDVENAQALAYNAELLYRVVEAQPPLGNAWDVLTRYDLGEIAALCEAYDRVAAGELEYGEAETT